MTQLDLLGSAWHLSTPATGQTHVDDPDSSIFAAKQASKSTVKHWRAILTALADAPDGLTADEMLPVTGISQRHVAQTRAGEMTAKHLKRKVFPTPLVEATDRRRKTSPSGMDAVVYVLTVEGRRVVEGWEAA